MQASVAASRGRRRPKPPKTGRHQPLTQQVGLAVTRGAICKKQMRGRPGGFSKYARKSPDVKLGRRCFLPGQIIALSFKGVIRSFSKRASHVHGIGLFAEEPFKAGEVLGFFTGELLTQREARARSQAGGKSIVTYSMGSEGYIFMDASRGRASPFQWINSVAGSATPPNVQFVVVGERMCVETIVAVGKWDELLADYDFGGAKERSKRLHAYDERA